MPDEAQKDDPALEELTISQASQEFHVNRKTINHYVLSGRLPARKEFSDLGVPYWLIRRGEVERLLANLPKDKRRPKRTP